jgi:hypothetical protein
MFLSAASASWVSLVGVGLDPTDHALRPSPTDAACAAFLLATIVITSHLFC